MAGPVEGIKVVELGVWVAGPATGGILARWCRRHQDRAADGDPGGMFGRMLGCDPVEPPFEPDNRSKRSIVLDLTTDEAARAAIDCSARRCVRHRRAPGALQRLGLDFESVAAATSAGLRPDRRIRRPGPTPTAPHTTWPRSGRARHRAPAHAPGRHAAVPARRHGRPFRGHDPGGGRVRGAGGRERTGAVNWCPRRCSGRDLHGRLRREHLPAHRSGRSRSGNAPRWAIRA